MSSGKSGSPVKYIGIGVAVVLLGILLDSMNSSEEADEHATPIATTIPDNSQAVTSKSTAEENIKPIGAVNVAQQAANGQATRSGEEVYNTTCAACHNAGVLNAPKLEKADWDPRISKGLDGLARSAINGIGQMPARGGASDITDEEIANAIIYMAEQSGHDLSDQISNLQVAAAAEAADTTADQPAAPPVAPEAPAAPQAPVASPAPTAPAQPPPPTPAVQTSQQAAATTNGEPPATSASVTPPSLPVVLPQPTVQQAVAPASPGVDGKKIYRGVCFSCHDVGIANSPMPGDKAAWEPRLANGVDALYASVINGKGAMPARGGNPALSDAELKAAVDWMIAY